MKNILIALMAVTPILLWCAAPAKADTSGYLWEIHAVNAQSGTSDPFMVGLGNAVCEDFRDGSTIGDIGVTIAQKGSPFSNLAAGEIIYASVDQLCPIYKAKAIAQVGGTGTIS